MRILHVTTASSPIAGAERLLLDIAHHVRGSNDHYELVTLQPGGDFNEAIEAEGWRTHTLDVSRPIDLLFGIRRLRRLIDQIRPDIIHTHLHHASFVAARAKRGLDVPIVHTRHYSDYIYRFGSRYARWIDRSVARGADRIIAISEAVEGALMANEKVDPRLIVHIPNGIDLERLHAFDRDEGRRLLAARYAGGRPLIGCAASYNPRKGHHILLNAMPSILDRFPEARLFLFGQDTDHPNLQRLIGALGIADHVQACGYVEEMHPLMAGLDLYVQPSIEEGFGIAVIEAMAMGIPVIASRVGGMEKTITDHETGRHVPPSDPAALAAAICTLFDDPQKMQRLAHKGRERADRDYTVGKMVAAYRSTYQDLIRAKRRLAGEIVWPAEAERSEVPLITIGLPTYNAESTIATAIRSILAQTIPDWELLVHDGGSMDRTLDIVRSFPDPRIRIISSGGRHEIAQSLNAIVRAARGPFFARMDSDDVSFPERLETQLAFLRQDPRVDLLATGVLVYQGDGKVLGVTPVYATHDEICRMPTSGFYLSHPSWMGRTDWFRMNPYDESMRSAEDQELLFRTYHRSRFACLPQILLGYREAPRTVRKMWGARTAYIHGVSRYGLRSRRPFAPIATGSIQSGKMVADLLNIKLGIKRLRNPLLGPEPGLVDRWNGLWQRFHGGPVAPHAMLAH